MMKLIRLFFHETHPIFKSNLTNILNYPKTKLKIPKLSRGEVVCIMCVWQEQYMVKYAIESSKDFVSRYKIVDKDGQTIPFIKESIDQWKLEAEIHKKPNLDLREARGFCLTNIDEPWILIQDGDEIFHTDGPQDIQHLRKYMDRPNIVFCTPKVVMQRDFNHVSARHPIQPPHKFLYHNNGTIRIANKGQYQPASDEWMIGFIKPYIFNCRIKPRFTKNFKVLPYSEVIYGPKPKVIRTSIPKAIKEDQT